MEIRFAEEQDSAALLEIYGQYIDTPVTFEYELPEEREFAERIRDVKKFYPYLACEENGRILGYAYAHRHMERAAYQWNAELSVYLSGEAVSRGMGTRLYQALIGILRLQGVKTVYGGVTAPNEKSFRLHRAMGFRLLGTYRRAGYKCGKWHDVCWFEKQIGPYEENPQPVRPVGGIELEKLEKILSAR